MYHVLRFIRRGSGAVALSGVLALGACAPPVKVAGVPLTPRRERRAPSGRVAQLERPALLSIVPTDLDFGEAVVGGESERMLVLSNTTGFSMQVLQATFNRACFSISRGFVLPLTVQAQAEVPLHITFRPNAIGECVGELLLEVDSAGGRIRKATMRGRGI